jgi:acyl dehydratase
MNLDYVTSLRFAPTEQSYDWRDSALYAMALGMGSDPLDEDELPYVYEGRQQQVVPSQCVTLGWQPFWQDDPAASIDWVKILHGEMGFVLHQPLPVQGRVLTEHRLCAVEDKGPQRGAILHFEHGIRDAVTSAPLATLRSLQFLRGDGGCGSFGAPLDTNEPMPEQAAATGFKDYKTLPQAALLYRLASRDWMPIHADPAVAMQAGFDRPISHGLNTMGIACRALLKHVLPGHPERLKAMSVRFVQPAFPGDTLRVGWIEQGRRFRFTVRALERDVLVLDRGDARWA